MLLHLILFLQLLGLCWFFTSKMLPVWECSYKEIVITTGLVTNCNSQGGCVASPCFLQPEGWWCLSFSGRSGGRAVGDGYYHVYDAASWNWKMLQVLAGCYCPSWEQDSLTWVPSQTQEYQILCRIRATTQGRAPLTEQQQSTSKHCMCRGSRAGCAAFLQSCHRRLAAWLGPGAALNFSKRLRELSGTVPACVSPMVLPSVACRIVPLCNVWLVWDRWNTTLCNQAPVRPFTISQYLH